MTRLLVAYATRCGSTKGVAEAIGRGLAAAGWGVDVRPVGEVRDLRPYRAAVIGSPIRGGRWLPEAVDFVRKNGEALKRMPVAYFAVCLTLRDDTEGNRSEVAACLDPVCELVQPVELGLFAGALDPSSLPLVLRLLLRCIKAPAGDFRDWNAIRAWAVKLGKEMTGKLGVGCGRA